ncbi:MAG: hypothetical protein EB141_10330 [Verrucomicrobia bacterium]|nr:hypothetical protein [Pseudomonadota bacterium]NDA67549.1 hypothetical protein [Verrucomicrobiota bacterium]NDB76023.1 hypothetical protein [Verrucomicrobiota bacterium]NDD38439.1 hypothetical protein [Verrucomicrobiota bacterium]NDE98412.1 hypothetical protein [Verrucomicrobiota bacterium]
MGVKLDVEIGGNAAGFATALNKAKADAKTFAGDVSGGVFKNFNTGFAGVVTGLKYGLIGAIVGIPALLASKFSELQDRAKAVKIGTIRTGLDVDQFQRVQNTTESVGLDSSSAAHAIDHIAKAQQELKSGSLDATRQTDKLAAAFAALGVNVSEIERLSPQQLFFRIASAMQDAAAAGKLTGEQLAAMKEVLGKSGPELIPAFAKGFEGNIKDTSNLSGEEVTKLVNDAKALDGVKGAWAAFGKRWADFAGFYMGGGKSALGWLFNANPGGKLSGETGIELSPEAIAGRERLTATEQSKRTAAAEAADKALADKKFAEEAKKIEAEIAAEKLKQGTPEERRLALLGDIAKHEQEIADIRMYQEAGAFSETEARKRIDLEELEILKRRGALKELERNADKKDADRWTRIGLIDRRTPLPPVQRQTVAQQVAAVGLNVKRLEAERDQLQQAQQDVANEDPRRDTNRNERLDRTTQRLERVEALLRDARRRFPSTRNETDPEFIGPARPEPELPPLLSPAAPGILPPIQMIFPGSTLTLPGVNAPPLGSNAVAPVGSTAMVPSAGNPESERQMLTQLQEANASLRESQASMRRLVDALA